jgi:GAF domain-containing protein
MRLVKLLTYCCQDDFIELNLLRKEMPQQSDWLLPAINAIAEVAEQASEPRQAFDLVVAKLTAALGIDCCYVHLLDEHGKLRLEAHHGLSPEAVEELSSAEVGQSLSSQVIRSGQPMLIADTSKEPRSVPATLTKAGLHSLAIVPLKSGERFTGAMGLSLRLSIASPLRI